MSITWFNGEPKEIVVTLTPIHLTINKPGTQFFETANQVMLGYDEKNQLLFIKPLSKNEVLRGDIPEHTRYNISINTSYGRITNKAFITKISSLFNLEFTDKGSKFRGQWISGQNMLEVSLKEVL
ncbi:MAG TPA: hypothetical protein VK005_01325 [Acholeplasma sp.]|nr:hypothetical protein [Acholeplasma sp.]